MDASDAAVASRIMDVDEERVDDSRVDSNESMAEDSDYEYPDSDGEGFDASAGGSASSAPHEGSGHYHGRIRPRNGRSGSGGGGAYGEHDVVALADLCSTSSGNSRGDDSRTEEGVENYFKDLEMDAQLRTGLRGGALQSVLEVIGWDASLLASRWNDRAWRADVLARAGVRPMPRATFSSVAYVAGPAGPAAPGMAGCGGRLGGGDSNRAAFECVDECVDADDAAAGAVSRAGGAAAGSATADGERLSGGMTLCGICLEELPEAAAGGGTGDTGGTGGDGGSSCGGGIVSAADDDPESRTVSFACGHRLHWECFGMQMANLVRSRDLGPYRCVYRDPDRTNRKCNGLLGGVSGSSCSNDPTGLWLASLPEDEAETEELRRIWEEMAEAAAAAPASLVAGDSGPFTPCPSCPLRVRPGRFNREPLAVA
ncbi:unnamed protein product, partial [Phaeothamnion confervicola]